jgi:protein involved in polysaccharide export with SLBB domain
MLLSRALFTSLNLRGVRDNKRTSLVTILLLIFMFCVGCGDNPPVVYPTVAPFDEAKLALGPADKLDLLVYYGDKQEHVQYTIDDSGEIQVKYIGAVKAVGKTSRQIRDEIRSRLADGYLVDPIVAVTVLEINSQKLLVFGQIARTGMIKFTPGMTITEAIAQSGGFGPMARKNMVKVTRALDGKKEIYKIPVEMIAEGSRPNFPMMPGDEVFVPERPW